MDRTEALGEIERLSRDLHRYQYEYYVLGRPSISDLEYDKLFDRLLALEQEFPDLRRNDSPTARIGSDLTNELPEVSHTIPVLSLDKCYAVPELSSWIEKTESNADMPLSFIIEEKIDGVSIVLYYEEGVLVRGVTRGNGFVGNDVTANIKTIGSIPLRLTKPFTIAVRGEIYLPKDRFQEINAQMEVPYANPRNLASGTLRRVKSSHVANVPLQIFVYEGFSEERFETHVGVLETLAELGFRVNPNVGFFSRHANPSLALRHNSWAVGTFEDIGGYIRKRLEERSRLAYEIDGLVVKVNELSAREQLGYTGHHPRWAIAYKFDAPIGVSTVTSIDIQVGRTGRITPVARIKPVSVGGSTISNVTLHNQDYIDQLELAVGDTVEVSRRGDVIPAIERVIEKNEAGNTTWKMPDFCPSCRNTLSIEGAHHFCTNPQCPDQIRLRIHFFAAKDQMDIENLGPETIDFLIDKQFVKDAADLYSFDYGKLLEFPGFGEKKVALIREGIEKSKSRPFRKVLSSLGIPELGQKAAELLVEAGYDSMEKLFELARNGDSQSLQSIPGIGPKTSESILKELSDERLVALVDRLKKAGVSFAENKDRSDDGYEGKIFLGQTWCVTGSFEAFKPRDLAMEEVKKRGGRVTGSVTGKTTHLLAGEGAGSKLEKALELGVKVVNESEFLALLRSSGEYNP